MPTGRPRAALAAALLAASAGAFAASDLGVLFHTPEERARLDQLRRGDPVEAAPSVARKAEVTGYVRRSDGRNTVWIDGHPVATNDRKNDPLFDPRRVRDLETDLPPSAVKVVPESRPKPAPR